jgi:hypothetical protein
MSLRGFSFILLVDLNQLWSCFGSSFPYLISWSQSKFSILNSWLILGQIPFLLLYFHSISFKLLVFHSLSPTSFLLIQLWGIIFHAWWSTLVPWSLYLLSYIKNLIFSSIWSNLSIYCFSSISFRFRSRGGNTYQTSIPDSVLSILSLTFPSQNLFVFFVLMCSWVDHVWVVLWSWVDLTTSFFDYMCSRKWSHISQRGANVCTLKWSPRLWAPLFNLSISWINLSISWINGLQYFIKSIQIIFLDQIVINSIILIFPKVWSFYPKSYLIKRKSLF